MSNHYERHDHNLVGDYTYHVCRCGEVFKTPVEMKRHFVEENEPFGIDIFSLPDDEDYHPYEKTGFGD